MKNKIFELFKKFKNFVFYHLKRNPILSHCLFGISNDHTKPNIGGISFFEWLQYYFPRNSSPLQRNYKMGLSFIESSVFIDLGEASSFKIFRCSMGMYNIFSKVSEEFNSKNLFRTVKNKTMIRVTYWYIINRFLPTRIKLSPKLVF